MTRELLIAGFGGQGVLSIGKTIVEAAMQEGLEVSWVPSYGPEMRGGTANCSVVLSDEPIGSPVVSEPMELIAMNGPALKKFEKALVPGGLVLINSSQCELGVERDDLKVYEVPIVEEALKLGNIKVANMVMLGAYIAASKALKPESIENILHHLFTGPKAHLVDLNIQALKIGAGYIH